MLLSAQIQPLLLWRKAFRDQRPLQCLEAKDYIFECLKKTQNHNRLKGTFLYLYFTFLPDSSIVVLVTRTCFNVNALKSIYSPLCLCERTSETFHFSAFGHCQATAWFLILAGDRSSMGWVLSYLASISRTWTWFRKILVPFYCHNGTLKRLSLFARGGRSDTLSIVVSLTKLSYPATSTKCNTLWNCQKKVLLCFWLKPVLHTSSIMLWLCEQRKKKQKNGLLLFVAATIWLAVTTRAVWCLQSHLVCITYHSSRSTAL